MRTMHCNKKVGMSHESLTDTSMIQKQGLSSWKVENPMAEQHQVWGGGVAPSEEQEPGGSKEQGVPGRSPLQLIILDEE